MTNRRASLLAALAALLLLPAPRSSGVDFTNGEVTAVPAKPGIVIDGDLSDWDLSAQEPVYISAQTAGTMNVEWAAMYDQEALYLSARVTMPGREYHNPSNPQDGFWWSDCLQVRLTSDPALPFPLDGNRDAASDRVVHLSFWKNTETGKDFLNLTFGTKLNRGSVFNPEGSKTVITTQGKEGYIVESRIPWAAMNVPGGVNPFKPSRLPRSWQRHSGSAATRPVSRWGIQKMSAHSGSTVPTPGGVWFSHRHRPASVFARRWRRWWPGRRVPPERRASEPPSRSRCRTTT